MISRPNSVFSLAVILLVALSMSRSLSPPAQASEKVRIGIPVVAMSQLPILIAQQNKLFQAEGFDAEVIQIRTALALPALMSGELDFTTSAETTIRAAISGMPLKAIGFIGVRSSLVLVSNPRINSVTALKGGKIAVSSLRTTTDFVARDILRHYGLNPDKDIVTFPLGSEANKIAAVKSGAVDAAIVTLPSDSIAEEQGLKKLVFAGDFIEGLQSGLATSVKKINENPARVQRMARVFVRSLEFTRSRRGDAVDFIIKQWQLSRRVAENSYDLMVKTFSPDGEAPERLVRILVDEVKRTQKIEREIALSDVVDFSFVREARNPSK
ncbi:MAG: ABC transporter substrate-binding protein [Candidatus Binatota bacterium]